MALRGKSFRWDAKGVTEAYDSSAAFNGAMLSLQNLIPSARQRVSWVPRPASLSKVTLAGNCTGLFCVGNVVYGWCNSTTYSGKDQPFAYNAQNNTMYTITIPGGAASLPNAAVASGADWVPPIIDIIGSRITMTHPGFVGYPAFGWLDISSFSDTTKTGSTHSSILIDTLQQSGSSTNVLQAGWQVGMTITGTGIPANTTISSIGSNGTFLNLSQAATATGTGIALSVAGGTATAPLYGSGNTNGAIQLAAPPVAVKGFFGRAYYAVPGAGVVFSDSGFPQQVTNATQALTFQNGRDVTAFGGLPFYQSTGAVLQALVCFQGDFDIQQITGDAALGNLAVNDLNIGVGTLSPLTIANTPEGLAFVAPDGLRVLNFQGQVSPPVGDEGRGVQEDFIKILYPSRTCAAYNQNVLRISVQSGEDANTPFEEYWYDFSRQTWSGPHTFPGNQIKPFQLVPNGFIVAPQSAPNQLFISTCQESQNDTYVENGNQMQFVFQTCLLPDNEEMAANSVVETTIMGAIPANETWSITCHDDHTTVLDTVSLAGPFYASAYWNSFNWGAPARWGVVADLANFQRQIPWHNPLVFKQALFIISGNCKPGLLLSSMRFRYQPLGYVLYANPPGP